MSALLAVALAHCLLPADQTAGWKQTPIPKSAPALAAPADVEQFRTGESALVLDPPRFQHSAEEVFGKLQLTFEVPRGAEHLRVRFRHDLDGMKVDATALDRQGRRMPLMDERRVGGDEVQVDWGPAEVAWVTLRLHHHLRERPVVREWRSGHQEIVSEAPSAPAFFRQSGMLIWRHPGGRRIELCDVPRQRLELQDWRPEKGGTP